MQPERSRNRGVLSLAAAVTFLGFLDTHLLLPVIALYATEMGAALGTVGLIIGLYSITNTPANILFGRLIDRFGSKVPLIVGLLTDALGMFLYSVCRLPLHLALVRIWHGASGGLVGPATMSLTAAQTTSRQRARTMSTYGIALAAATLVGYGISGLIVNRLGYPVLFYLGAILLVIGAIIGLFLPGGRRERRISTPAAPSPASLKKLLGKRGLLVSYCAIFAQYFTFGGVVTLLPLHLKDQGLTAMHVGILMAFFAVLFIIAQFPAGALSDRSGRRMPTAIGLGLGAISLAVLPLLQNIMLLAAVMALYGVAYGILFPSVSALVVDNTEPGERGLATGIFHALITSGVAIGAPLIGWTGELLGVQPGMMLTAVIMALAMMITLALSPQQPA